MDIRQIKELMTAMEKTGTQRLTIKQENYELSLERHEDKSFSEYSSLPEYYKSGEQKEEKIFGKQDMHFFRTSGGAPTEKGKSHSEMEAVQDPSKAKKGEIVKSPMVGTFYLASSPEDPPFVKMGDVIQPDSVVCIIEAMKVMNEIKSGLKGRMMEFLVENGQPVEFGTPLFRIEP